MRCRRTCRKGLGHFGARTFWRRGQLGAGHFGAMTFGRRTVGPQENWAPDNRAPNCSSLVMSKHLSFGTCGLYLSLTSIFTENKTVWNYGTTHCDAISGVNPKAISCDFELAAISAMKEQQIVGTRGRPKFAYNGYLYVFDKKGKKELDVKFWRCEKL